MDKNKLKEEFKNLMSKENQNEEILFKKLMRIASEYGISYREFDDVSNDEEFNKNLIKIFSNDNRDYFYDNDIDVENIYSLFHISNNYDVHKKIFELFSDILENEEKKNYLLKYCIKKKYQKISCMKKRTYYTYLMRKSLKK